MFTVLSNIRNTNLYLAAAVIFILVAVLTITIVPSMTVSKPVVIPETGSPKAFSNGEVIRELRQEGLSLNNEPMASSSDATFREYDIGQFRREELCNRSENSGLNGAAFQNYCSGEWTGQ